MRWVFAVLGTAAMLGGRTNAEGWKESYTGPVEVTVADRFDGGAGFTVYRYRSPRDGREIVARQDSAAAAAIGCGDHVRLEGERSGDTVRVREVSLLRRNPAGADALCTPLGTQRVAVILATFPGMRPPVMNAGTLRRMLFDEDRGSLAAWFRRASYGKTDFQGTVFGPYTLDRTYTCEQTTAMRAAAIQAAGRDVDFRAFQRVVLIIPPSGDCGWGGLSTIGCTELQSAAGPFRASWMWFVDGPETWQTVHRFIHEMGHSLGLGHARFLRFPGESLGAEEALAVPVEYGDSTSAMGSGEYGDFAAKHKAELEWLTGDAGIQTVEEDGEFLLAPLEAGQGLRGLRIRRHAGAAEWLWVEFRRQPLAPNGTLRGLNGVLLRSESPAAESQTNLIDATPATLDESRFDLGVASEESMEIRMGSEWRDRHGAVELRVGVLTAEGLLPVTVRYARRCAVVEGDRTVAAEGEDLEIPVAVTGEGCDWDVSSNRHWLGVTKRNEAAVTVRVAPVEDGADRAGTVTIGRTPVQVTQRGKTSPPELLSFLAEGGTLPLGAALPFLAELRDANGAADLEVIQFRLTPGPCHFRYSTVRRVVEVSRDGETFVDDVSPEVGQSGACALQVQFLRPGPDRLQLRLGLKYAGGEGDPVTLWLKTEEKTGGAGEWIRAAELRATARECRALPSFNFFTYAAPAVAGGVLDVASAPNGCPWTATSDAGWLRVRQSAGTGAIALRFDLEENPEPSTRQGRIWVNGVPLLVTQRGREEILPERVTLRPSETVVSSLPGVGGLIYFYPFADGLPVESQTSWLRYLRVRETVYERMALYTWEGNPGPEPRVGVLIVGGKSYTVVQLGAR